ncbi:MAG: hypothetical protein AAFQ19_08405 [Pseudomonadota bacterium]
MSTAPADHLAAFAPRDLRPLPVVQRDGWALKRYAILAADRHFDTAITEAALAEALRRLPVPGPLTEASGNHGIGIQIVHFAETAVVAPLFYWQWGSVLARADQLRAPWTNPTAFGDGAAQVIGCVWEMDIVTFEIDAWRRTMLSGQGTPAARAAAYLDQKAT